MTPEEKALLTDIARRLRKLEKSDRYVFEKLIQLFPGRNIQTDTTTGSSFGNTTDDKVSVYGVDPVAQAGAISSLTVVGTDTDATARAAINDITTALKNFGIIA